MHVHVVFVSSSWDSGALVTCSDSLLALIFRTCILLEKLYLMFSVVAVGDISLHDPAHNVTIVIIGRDYRYTSLNNISPAVHDSATLHKFLYKLCILHFVWSGWNQQQKSTDK